MSANIDRTRAGIDAWNRSDLDAWLEMLDPDIEFQLAQNRQADRDRAQVARILPDSDPVYRGREGIARFWQTVHEPWRELLVEIDYIEEREDWVVVAGRARATGHHGMRVDMPVATAIRYRDGLAVEMIGGNTVQEAWQAIGGLPGAPVRFTISGGEKRD